MHHVRHLATRVTTTTTTSIARDIIVATLVGYDTYHRVVWCPASGVFSDII
jgi:hypothetical protein